jgi:hypothetical protein
MGLAIGFVALLTPSLSSPVMSRSLFTSVAPFLLLALVASGCRLWLGGDESAYRAELSALQQQIDAAIGDALADDVSQCIAIAYGRKACGGPSRARVYSLTDGNPGRVVSLTERYTRLEDEMNQRFGLASDCAYLYPPSTLLVEGRCVAGPPQHHD